jgi:hypothetical protein
MPTAASSLRACLCGRSLAFALSFAFALTAAMPAVSAELASGKPAGTQPASTEPVAASTSSEQIERMTAHLMAMLPMDRIFAQSMEQHRDELEKQLNNEQRSCFERELGQDAFFARKRAEVRRFAEEDPQAFAAGLKVLNEGAADLITKIMTATLAGNEYDMNQAQPDTVVAFMGFAYATEHDKLRTLAGFDDFGGEQKGVALAAMMSKLTEHLGGTCEIPQEFFQ